LTIIADDLTGAADAAGAYGQTHSSAIIFSLDTPWPDADIVAIDTESRYLPESEAARLVATAVRRSLSMGRPVYKKIDSLLRGNVGVEVSAALAELANEEHGLAVVAPAYPATGRTTVGGVVHVNGVPHSSGVFAGDIPAALAAAGLTAGRAESAGRTVEELALALRSLHGQGLDAVVLDAACDEDLERVARATESLGFPVLLSGSGGLASHLVPCTASPRGSLVERLPMSRILVVVGSYSSLARSQVQTLLKLGVQHVELPLGEPSHPRALARLAGSTMDVVLTPDLAAAVEKADALDVAAALAAAVLAVVDDYDAVVLTGGETARAVIDALGVEHMTVLGEVEPGVVLSRFSGDGPALVTKAGAFGDEGTLARIIQSLKAPSTEVGIYE
jgi:uncharacterized protein YgbK (DUF1537 family)